MLARDSVAEQEVGQRLVFCGEALVLAVRACRLDQLDGALGVRVQTAALGGSDLSGPGHRGAPGFLGTVDLGPLHRDVALNHLGGPHERGGQEVAPAEDGVHQAQVEGLLGGHHPVVVQRVLDDRRDGLVGTHEVRGEPVAAPSRQDADRDLGQRQPDAARGRPVGALQPDLEATAEGDAVEERERRHGALAQAPHHAVAELGERDGVGVVADVLHTLEVGADGEAERLGRHADGDDARYRVGLGDRLVQLEQGLLAQTVGLHDVQAVVQRDQRHRAGAERKLDLPQQRVGDPLDVCLAH